MAHSGLHRTVLGIALPAMLTNVATALFGLADMWIVGRLGDAAAQGGVEIGAKLLMTLFIVFNFLRASTAALTAQAVGRNDEAAKAQILVRAVTVALVIGVILLSAAPIVVPLGLHLFSATGAVAEKARLYVVIRYAGGAPWLLNAALTGWLIGQRRVRAVLFVEVGSNLVHILLDAGLVLGAGFGVAGVAAATLASESLKLGALGMIVAFSPAAAGVPAAFRARSIWRASAFSELLRLNRDLFVRTALLMSAIVILTRAGARQGAVILAANAILYQFFILSALLLDGFETAAQVLCGESIGAGGRAAFTRLIRVVLAWAAGTALLISLVYAVAAPQLAMSFSTMPAVIQTVRAYAGWAIAMPLAGVASYVFDGVFIGSSWTRPMMISMAAALLGFIIALEVLRPFGDNGLWFAFTLFLALRGGGQALMTPRLLTRAFSAGAPSLAGAPQR
jgi:MATE family multidrug resistance protein